MANKVIPIRKTPLKPGVVATVRRSLVLRAGKSEIAVEITAEARLLRTACDAIPPRAQSNVVPITSANRGGAKQ